MIAHNFTGANKLTIPATTDKDYVLTGTFNSTGPAIFVSIGFKGTITLNNVTIYTTNDTACILLQGGIGNLPIQTQATLHLIGNNKVHTSKGINVPIATGEYAAITIRAGTQLTIDGEGSLDARMYDDILSTVDNGGQPAIGASFTYPPKDTTVWDGTCPITNPGGNLIIKSGTILARGAYHSAGIGAGVVGGLKTIVITGGKVTSVGGYHGSGIGGGCRALRYTSSIVVLPPTIINASSANADINPVGGGISESSGILSVFYMGDPAQKKLRVTAQQRGGSALTGRQNVNILFDVSNDATISSALRLANLNPARWFAGSTGTQGFWETTGKIVGNVKVYSDTPTQQTPTAYYSSKRVSVPGTSDVHIILEEPDMSTPWLLITQDKTAWTNSDITLTVRHNPAIPYLTRMRPQGGTWVTGVTSITSKVSTNGTYYFEAENEDGNTMTVSHKVSNIDKAKPTVNVN